MSTKLHYRSMGGPKRPKAPRTEEETRNHLAKIWDDDADDKFETAQKLLQEFGTEELFSYLEHSTLGNYSGLIERIYQIAENREKVLKSSDDNPLNYDSMATATVKSLNLKTRDDLNRAVSDAVNEYTESYGSIDSAPQGDLFIVP